jgi:hypothetical protein
VSFLVRNRAAVLAHSLTLVGMIRAGVSASPSVYVGPILRGLPRRADPPSGFVAFYRSRMGFAAFHGRGRLRGFISPSAVDAIASAIQTQEGYYPGSLAYQNNNPGNLVYAGQPGASPGAGGFARFSSYDLGLQAMKNQIQLDADRGTDVNGNPTTTLAQLIGSWAPPSQNNTPAYVSAVSSATGFDPDAPLSSLGAGSLFPSDAGFDLSSIADSTVDLSSLGLSSQVSTPLLVGGGLVGLLILSRLF